MPDLDLHQVACGDVLLGAPHGGQVVLLGKEALLSRWHAGMAVGDVDRFTQADAQILQALLGARVGFGLRRICVDHQVDATGQIVDDHQFVGLQQENIRGAIPHPRGEWLDGRAEPGFDVSHGVVAEVTREAAGEPGHSRP